ncbi:hypothetical protein JXD20_04595 [Candidatus Peregrinibacteria bacterium]|nr:hypothetical protein [Candidatus Peregrinibacteria bacterium]
MSSYHPPKPEEPVTPREFFQIIQFGTGKDFDRHAFQQYRERLGLRCDEIVRQTRDYFTKIVGIRPAELSEIAPNGTFPTSESYAALQEQIRTSICANISFLQTYAEEHREAGLRRMGTEANNYLNRLRVYYFPGEESLETKSEVEICNDAAGLVMLAFNDDVDKRVKFEAARKLLLMQYVGEIRNYNNPDEDSNEALHYILGLFNERILRLPEGARMGHTTPRYLVSRHAPNTYETVHTDILDKKPTHISKGGLTQVTHLPSRKTTVIGTNGKKREIFFGLDPREKGEESRLTKALRYGSHIGERDVDRNGLKLVFEKREDWEDFFAMFQAEIKCEIGEALRERLKKEDISETERVTMTTRLDNLDDCIQIMDVKDSLAGNGFEGGSLASSKEFKVLKFRLNVTRANGQQHKYEFQIFLPDGYADAKYRKGVSWEEYRADRFFKEGVDKLLFPEKHYGELDRKAAHDRVMQRAHENLWPTKPH